jgi:hypothetical protein
LHFATRSGAGAFRLVSRPVSDRAEPATPQPAAPAQALPTSTAPDGRVAITIYKDGRTSVAVVPPDGGAPHMLTDGPFDEAAAAFSPDGRWLVLESTASGRIEVIVRAAVDGRRIGVSTDGGRRPSWSENGHAILFTSGRRLLRAAFDPDTATPVSHPEVVRDHAGDRVVSVAPSGRLLIERQSGAETAVIVLQWLRELRERLPQPVSTPR